MSEGSARVPKRLTTLIGRFAIVGLLNTAVHALTTVMLVEVFYTDPVLASVVGFLLAVVVSFILNTWWTFKQKDKLQQRFFRFMVVSVTAMMLNTAIMYIAVNVLAWHYLAGLALVLLVVPAYNFLLNLKWSYRADL